ncbi:MAG: undecaprenyl/decaprenyl-phosphate alpha-N-acetylglucosaminyl 1-phosphate transferase [Nocardioidaceae bacterium]|nr:undecaprenyl/decaprenyl-phosphate alpha-N-acetylglucosaminyl 1-phosphate transferase [Nocardioidaceae bacterium]
MYEYLLIFLTALAVTYVLAVPARELAMRFGAFARVRDRDVHEIPIPYFGGVAMMGGLAAAYLVATQLPFLNNSPERSLIFGDALAVLLGGALICLLGAVDDVFELDALTKLAGEMLAAGIVVVQGVQLYLPLPGDEALGLFSLGGSEATLVTVFFIVMSVNAVNFVDGLDGLAAGVVGIGAVAFFVFSVALVVFNQADKATTATMLTAALAGVCFGFLPHNFFPARMFMGDSGALLIGFMLAGSVISLTSQFSAGTLERGIFGADASLLPTLLPLILPVAVLLVPFLDLVMAVFRRTRAGRSPFSPDREHLHHRLLEIGHSQRRAVLVMYLWTGLIAFGVVVVSLVSGWWSALGVATMAAVALLLTFGVPGHRGIINSDEV